MTHRITTPADNSEKINFIIGFILLLIACTLIAGKFGLPKREGAIRGKEVVNYKIASNQGNFMENRHTSPALVTIVTAIKDLP